MSELNKKIREEILKKVRTVVVKVGSNVLTDDAGLINRAQIATIASQIAHLRKKGYDVVLVTSGAIGAGIGELRLGARPKTLSMLQAVAAVGQCTLMREYYRSFGENGVAVSQILLTGDDLKVRVRHINARNTLRTLLELGVLPVINENDTVSTDEIKFGDNDRLSALVANLIGAEMLVILSNVEGLIDFSVSDHAVVSVVESIGKRVEDMCVGRKSKLGTGGMVSKLTAAKIINRAGEAMMIASGLRENVLVELFEGRNIGTLFLPKTGKMAGRKRWIAFFVAPAGSIIVDDGAERALKEGGKSLLASGVRQAAGTFKAGDTISVKNMRGEEFGRGLINYSSKEIEQIKGLKTGQIAASLGKKSVDEVIHRDDLVIL
jgi:glutamate 5-kinase